MTIHFLQPPPEQRVGGLEAAITGLRDALRRAGIAVVDGAPADDARDVVLHFHGLWQPQHARLSCHARRRGWPCVVSPHGMLEPWAWRHKRWKKWPYFQLFERAHLRRSACVLATAEAEAARLRAMLPGLRVETLPLGMTGAAGPDYAAARASFGWAPDDRVILFLSRIHVKKGLDLLLRALVELGMDARTRLIVVGDGDGAYVAQMRALAARLPRVEWTGWITGDARWRYLQGADLFCLPSHSENFGLAVLEACQVGTLALTTTTTPWAGALGGGRGLIVEPTLAGVKAGLTEFLEKPPRTGADRAALAEWACAGFDWDALAPRYVELYRSIAG